MKLAEIKTIKAKELNFRQIEILRLYVRIAERDAQKIKEISNNLPQWANKATSNNVTTIIFPKEKLGDLIKENMISSLDKNISISEDVCLQIIENIDNGGVTQYKFSRSACSPITVGYKGDKLVSVSYPDRNTVPGLRYVCFNPNNGEIKKISYFEKDEIFDDIHSKKIVEFDNNDLLFDERWANGVIKDRISGNGKISDGSMLNAVHTLIDKVDRSRKAIRVL